MPILFGLLIGLAVTGLIGFLAAASTDSKNPVIKFLGFLPMFAIIGAVLGFVLGAVFGSSDAGRGYNVWVWTTGIVAIGGSLLAAASD